MKSWHSQIKDHIERWKRNLPRDRALWPSHVYHFTDVQNAASILRSDRIYSRALARKLGLMTNDNASSGVIAQTPEAHLEFVRLYFRPRTPTQFHNEGIKLPQDRYQGSHCPVPIFFCFDAFDLLSRDGVLISDGNMGKHGTQYGDDLQRFQSIRFEDVFHHGGWSQADSERIKNARHCEVLIKDELDLLSTLKAIVCRSPAERQTLLHLVPAETRKTWESRVRVNPTFFERRGTYVETVNVVGRDLVQLDFHLGKGAAEMLTRFELREEGKTLSWTGKLTSAALKLRVRDVLQGVARVDVANCLAFSGDLVLDDIPF